MTMELSCSFVCLIWLKLGTCVACLHKFLCWLILILLIYLCVRRGPTLLFGPLGPVWILRSVRIHRYAGEFATHQSAWLLLGDKRTRQDGMSSEGFGEGLKWWLQSLQSLCLPLQNYPLHGADVNGFHSGSAAYSHSSSMNGSDSILGKLPSSFLI